MTRFQFSTVHSSSGAEQALDTGIVVREIQPAIGIDRLFDHRLDLRGVADVDLEEGGLRRPCP